MSLLDQSQRFEDVDNVIQSPNFCFDHRIITGGNQNLGSFIERQRCILIDEKFEEGIGQVLKRLLLFISKWNVIITFLAYKLDCCYCFPQSPPNIIVFALFFNYIQTLKNIDNVIDAATLHAKLNSHFIQLQNGPTSTFEVVNELLAKFLKTFFLAIVSKYLLFNFLLVDLFLNGTALRADYLKNWFVFCKQSTDEKSVLIRRKINLVKGKLLRLVFQGEQALGSIDTLLLLLDHDNLNPIISSSSFDFVYQIENYIQSNSGILTKRL